MGNTPIGGGTAKVIKRSHFWKAAILFILIIGGIRAWHFFKLRHDVRAEQSASKNFQAKQSPPINPKAILPQK